MKTGSLKQYPSILELVKLASLAVVDFQGNNRGVRKWDDPETLGVQGAADEEVHLVGCISLLRG